MTITPAQLEEWKRLESEATAGEWLNDVEGCVGIRYAEGGQATICTCPIAFSYHNGRNDAAFIASSRTALPALIAEVERLNAEAEWQPIETAPRDGTEFLAFGSYLYEGDKTETIYYRTACWSGDENWPWEDEEGKHPHGFFSHWRPLTPPSKEPGHE